MPGITEEQFKAAGNYLVYSTIPLTDIHLNSNLVAEMSANNDMQSIYILSFIAIFLIVLASVNFMNLSTAHSLKRAKEVGVRKTLGSNKKDLVTAVFGRIRSNLFPFFGVGLTYGHDSPTLFQYPGGKGNFHSIFKSIFLVDFIGCSVVFRTIFR